MRVTVKVSHSSSPSIFDTENSPSRKANPKVSQIRRCFASWPKTSQLSPPPGHCCKSFPSSEGVLPMNEARDAPMLFGQTRLQVRFVLFVLILRGCSLFCSACLCCFVVGICSWISLHTSNSAFPFLGKFCLPRFHLFPQEISPC